MDTAVGQTEGLLFGLIIVIVTGAIVGWLAGLIVKGSGFGLAGDVIVGIAGSFFAGFLLPRLGLSLSGSMLGGIVASVIGAIALLLILRLIRRAV